MLTGFYFRKVLKVYPTNLEAEAPPIISQPKPKNETHSGDLQQILFGDVLLSMLTLFQLMTLDSWTPGPRVPKETEFEPG